MAQFRLIPNRQGGYTVIVTAGFGGLVHHREVRELQNVGEASEAVQEMAENVQKWRDNPGQKPG